MPSENGLLNAIAHEVVRTVLDALLRDGRAQDVAELRLATLCVERAGACRRVPGEYNTEVAELIAVKGTLSDGDLANVQAYYKQKYKLTN